MVAKHMKVLAVLAIVALRIFVLRRVELFLQLLGAFEASQEQRLSWRAGVLDFPKLFFFVFALFEVVD